ncbi:MAG: S8 family serine peptidase, partial [Planctomycetota bacterium]
MSKLIDRLGLAAPVAVVVAVALTAPAVAQQDAPVVDELGQFATTHIIVKVQDGLVPMRTPRGQWTIGSLADRAAAPDGDPVADVLTRWGVSNIVPALPRAPRHAELADELGLNRYYKIFVTPGTDTFAMSVEMGGLADVIEHAEVDGLGGVAGEPPDDPSFGLQYALMNVGQTINGQPGMVGADIKATEAWEITTGTSGITLAVLDSGVNAHTELDGRLMSGWNTVNNNNNTADSCGSHGTHVSGSAAANGNNTLGIAGVDWNVSILPVRILSGCSGL